MSTLANWFFGLFCVGVVVYLVVRSIIRQKPDDDYPSENGDGSYP